VAGTGRGTQGTLSHLTRTPHDGRRPLIRAAQQVHLTAPAAIGYNDAGLLALRRQVMNKTTVLTTPSDDSTAHEAEVDYYLAEMKRVQ